MLIRFLQNQKIFVNSLLKLNGKSLFFSHQKQIADTRYCEYKKHIKATQYMLIWMYIRHKGEHI